MKSNLQNKLHVALIMDGNGRWAQNRNLPRSAGHKAGVKTIRSMVEAAPKLGINLITLYAFSSDNWKRPVLEVSLLMNLFRLYLRSELKQFLQNDIRLVVIGRRDRLPEDLVQQIVKAEAATAHGKTLTLRIAIDYSAREAILRALTALQSDQKFEHETLSKHLSGLQQNCDVDLLIRTSGEKRLSDFLLWECAYSELYFTDTLWPDFSSNDLQVALEEFYTRNRRFGGLANANEDSQVHQIREAV